MKQKLLVPALVFALALTSCAPSNGRAELILDRPFLFFIKVNGMPLFVGAVNQM